jgi:hypothetical protein
MADGQTIVWDAATGRFNPASFPAGGSGFPFSNSIYLDGATATPVPDQNGSAVAAFGVFATALAAVPTNGNLLISSYTLAEAFDLNKKLWITSVGPSPAPEFVGNAPVTIGDVTITGGVGNGFLGLWGCAMGAFDGTAHSFDLYLRAGAQVLGAVIGLNNLNIDDGLVQAVTCSGVTAYRGRFGGNLTIDGTEVRIQQSVFVGLATITFSGTAGTVFIDRISLQNFHESGGTIINGGVQVTDGPASLYQFGAANTDTGEFFNPGIKFGTSVGAPPTGDYYSNNGTTTRYAHYMRVKVPGGFAGNAQSYQLFVGSTIAGLVATNLEVTLAANAEEGELILNDELVEVPLAGVFAVQFSAGGLSMNALPCEIWVGLS